MRFYYLALTAILISYTALPSRAHAKNPITQCFENTENIQILFCLKIDYTKVNEIRLIIENDIETLLRSKKFKPGKHKPKKPNFDISPNSSDSDIRKGINFAKQQQYERSLHQEMIAKQV